MPSAWLLAPVKRSQTKLDVPHDESFECRDYFSIFHGSWRHEVDVGKRLMCVLLMTRRLKSWDASARSLYITITYKHGCLLKDSTSPETKTYGVVYCHASHDCRNCPCIYLPQAYLEVSAYRGFHRWTTSCRVCNSKFTQRNNRDCHEKSCIKRKEPFPSELREHITSLQESILHVSAPYQKPEDCRGPVTVIQGHNLNANVDNSTTNITNNIIIITPWGAEDQEALQKKSEEEIKETIGLTGDTGMLMAFQEWLRMNPESRNHNVRLREDSNGHDKAVIHLCEGWKERRADEVLSRTMDMDLYNIFKLLQQLKPLSKRHFFCRKDHEASSRDCSVYHRYL